MTQSDTPKGEKSARSQEQAIAALLTHARLEDAARAAGVSRSTLCRMLADTAFQEAFRQARRQVLDAALSRLQAAAAPAVEALTRNLTCRKAAIEVSAARTILDQSIKSLELLELDARIARLEDAMHLAERKRR